MHIGLNAQLLSGDRGYRQAGISRYIYNLVNHLLKLEDGHTYTAFGGEVARLGLSPKLRLRPTRLGGMANPGVRILWEQALQPWEVRRAGVELLHSMAYVLPLVKPCRTVVTVHDLSFIRFPELFPRQKARYLAAFTRHSVRRADAVIAVSRRTRADLVELLGAAPEKVAVVYSGVGEEFHPLEEGKRGVFREGKGLEGGYILFLGTLEPRKNLVRLLRAYAILRERGLGKKLVIAGSPGWLTEGIDEVLEALKLERDVLLPGFIDQEELPLWYGAADVFVYPSLYEGFGLPALEAMASSVPVVASDAGALPEVVGEAGLLCDPYDVAALAGALEKVLSDGELRREMVAKGLERAGQFSWERTARETVAVYERAGGRAN